MKLKHINLQYNQKKLVEELHKTKMYDSTQYKASLNTVWLKGIPGEDCAEAKRIKDFLPESIISTFFIQPANTVILPHTDGRCSCSLNILLSDGGAPIIIEGEEFEYKCALINVSKYMHEVPAYPKDRYLLRYAFSQPFEKILEFFEKNNLTTL